MNQRDHGDENMADGSDDRAADRYGFGRSWSQLYAEAMDRHAKLRAQQENPFSPVYAVLATEPLTDQHTITMGARLDSGARYLICGDCRRWFLDPVEG